MSSKVLYESLVQFCRDNDLEEKEIPTVNKFGRAMWDKCSFLKKRTQSGVIYRVFGIDEATIMEHVIIGDVPGEDGSAPESFIKDDD